MKCFLPYLIVCFTYTSAAQEVDTFYSDAYGLGVIGTKEWKYKVESPFQIETTLSDFPFLIYGYPMNRAESAACLLETEMSKVFEHRQEFAETERAKLTIDDQEGTFVVMTDTVMPSRKLLFYTVEMNQTVYLFQQECQDNCKKFVKNFKQFANTIRFIELDDDLLSLSETDKQHLATFDQLFLEALKAKSTLKFQALQPTVEEVKHKFGKSTKNKKTHARLMQFYDDHFTLYKGLYINQSTRNFEDIFKTCCTYGIDWSAITFAESSYELIQDIPGVVSAMYTYTIAYNGQQYVFEPFQIEFGEERCWVFEMEFYWGNGLREKRNPEKDD